MRSGIFKKVLCLFLSGLMIMPSSFALGAGKKDGIKANTQIMSENLRKEFELKEGRSRFGEGFDQSGIL